MRMLSEEEKSEQRDMEVGRVGRVRVELRGRHRGV